MVAVRRTVPRVNSDGKIRLILVERQTEIRSVSNASPAPVFMYINATPRSSRCSVDVKVVYEVGRALSVTNSNGKRPLEA
jgi:hypothetical protein